MGPTGAGSPRRIAGPPSGKARAERRSGGLYRAIIACPPPCFHFFPAKFSAPAEDPLFLARGTCYNTRKADVPRRAAVPRAGGPECGHRRSAGAAVFGQEAASAKRARPVFAGRGGAAPRDAPLCADRGKFEYAPVMELAGVPDLGGVTSVND